MGDEQAYIRYPVVSLHKIVVYPTEIVTLTLDSTANRSAIFGLDLPDETVALIFYQTSQSTEPLPVAIEAKVLSRLATGHEQDEVILQGIRRLTIQKHFPHDEPIDGE